MSNGMNFKERRGATAQAYALMVGLVSVVALAAVTGAGSSVDALMTNVGSKLDTGNLESGGSGGSGGATPTPSASGSPVLTVSGALIESDPGQWSDGSHATSCWDYMIAPTPDAIPAQPGEDGVYTIDPDGSGGVAPFDVLCDMTTDGGGWTLVDVVANNGDSMPSRTVGSATSLSVTTGNLLPGYDWSSSPQLLCMADLYTGTLPWRSFDIAGSGSMLSYPTSAAVGSANTDGGLSYAISNGNTNQGLNSWVTAVNGGTLWIGGSHQPSCACGYRPASQSGLGGYQGDSGTNRCSSWVR